MLEDAAKPVDSLAGHHRPEVGLWIEIRLEVRSGSDHDHPGLLPPTQPSNKCGKLECGRKLVAVFT